jgi:hypothetical protein
MARISLTAKSRKRIGNKRNALAALRNAGMPILIEGNLAYFIGTDERGRRFEMILAADTRDDARWFLIHALQTSYRKNW